MTVQTQMCNTGVYMYLQLVVSHGYEVKVVPLICTLTDQPCGQRHRTLLYGLATKQYIYIHVYTCMYQHTCSIGPTQYCIQVHAQVPHDYSGHVHMKDTLCKVRVHVQE